MACFPGSSGSPVFVETQFTSTGNIMITDRSFYLAGILYAGHEYTADGEIVVREIPTQKRPFTETRIPMNLGVCIKASRLAEFDKILLDHGVKPPQGYVPKGPS